MGLKISDNEIRNRSDIDDPIKKPLPKQRL